MGNIRCLVGVLAGIGLLTATSAHAHMAAPADGSSALMAGLSHPLLGWDHLLAAIAIGLWAAWQRQQPWWVLPLVFAGMATAGGMTGQAGLGLPFAAAGAPLVLCLVGLLMAFSACLPKSAGMLLVAWLAGVYGYAHGAAIPPGTDALAHGAGFLGSSVALLALTTAVGRISSARWRAATLRCRGAAIAAAGMLAWA